jgi:uncharacterized protein with WD repeat
MEDEVFYNQVAEEIQAKKLLPGLWTKAFAEANGKTDEARAIYIKHRVEQLVQEHARIEREKRELLKEEQRIRRLSDRMAVAETVGKYFVWIFFIIFAATVVAVIISFFIH